MTWPLHPIHQLLCLCGEDSGDGSMDWSTQGDRGRGLARVQEGDWYQERIPLELGQKLLPPPLAGALVLETPIEPHFDFKHISAFYGGMVYDFKVWLSMGLLSW